MARPGWLETELFGHERGAFTSAYARRRGLFAEAHQGTLLLDEVDTLSRKAQVTLLRVLQDKRFRPVGCSAEQRADIRIIAATNADLPRLVQAGEFRSDLYYRLCVFSIHLPALRDRRGDILVLASHFLDKHVPRQCSGPPTLGPGALAAMLAYQWPGNVRELENAIIRGAHLCRRDVIEIVLRNADVQLHVFSNRLSTALQRLQHCRQGELAVVVGARAAVDDDAVQFALDTEPVDAPPGAQAYPAFQVVIPGRLNGGWNLSANNTSPTPTANSRGRSR